MLFPKNPDAGNLSASVDLQTSVAIMEKEPIMCSANSAILVIGSQNSVIFRTLSVLHTSHLLQAATSKNDY